MSPTPPPPSASTEIYRIPAPYRKLENTHILFWLVKDISWCMVWKALGMMMIVPTLAIAIVIAWRTRRIQSERAHNLAIVFWITANSYWMTSEFFGFDEKTVLPGLDGRHLAIVPFLIGLLILAYYYLVQKPREDRTAQEATL